MRKLIAKDFRHYVPEGEGERRNTYIELGEYMRNHITAEFRCANELVVSGVDEDGQTVYLGSGRIVYLDGVLDGFVSVEVNADAPYCYWVRAKGRWLEVPDPIPVAVKIDEPVNKPIADLVRQELHKYLARRSMDSELATDVSVEELLDDLEHGDLEFEEEPDQFGLGYEERLEEFVAAKAEKKAQEGELPLEGSDPAQPVKPAEASASDGSPPAEKPGKQITT